MSKKSTIKKGVTTVEFTEDLLKRIRDYNKKNPNNKINKSEIARGAIEEEFERRLKENLT